LGVPDLGITTLEDVLVDARRITDVTSLPLLVDADTGFGSAFNIARTVRSLIKSRRGCHAHRRPGAGQTLRSPPGQGAGFKEEMVDRIKASGGCPPRPVLWHYGTHRCIGQRRAGAALERAAAYVEAGADFLFAEALTDPSMYADFAKMLAFRSWPT
jgi:methylisocitrate lyase